MLVSLPRPDDYVAFARRGLFAYDWQDIHRTIGRTFRYELLARPDTPALVEELESAAAGLARKVQFQSLQFADSASIVVADHVDC